MEVLLNLQNKNVTLNAVHVAPEGTKCCNRLKVHFDVFQETAKKAAIIRLSTANINPAKRNAMVVKNEM